MIKSPGKDLPAAASRAARTAIALRIWSGRLVAKQLFDRQGLQIDGSMSPPIPLIGVGHQKHESCREKTPKGVLGGPEDEDATGRRQFLLCDLAPATPALQALENEISVAPESFVLWGMSSTEVTVATRGSRRFASSAVNSRSPGPTLLTNAPMRSTRLASSFPSVKGYTHQLVDDILGRGGNGARRDLSRTSKPDCSANPRPRS